MNNNGSGPIREVSLSVNDLHHLCDLVYSDYEEHRHFRGAESLCAQDQRLYYGFLKLWSYWSPRTPDAERLTLTIRQS